MPPSVEAVCVDPKRVHEVWPTVAPLIKKAMARGDLGTFDCVEADVLSARALLWVAWADPFILGAAVTQIIGSEQGKVCLIVACGGKRVDLWLNLIEKIEEYAKAESCRCTRIMGRKGWARLLSDYQIARVVIEKDLR